MLYAKAVSADAVEASIEIDTADVVSATSLATASIERDEVAGMSNGKGKLVRI